MKSGIAATGSGATVAASGSPRRSDQHDQVRAAAGDGLDRAGAEGVRQPFGDPAVVVGDLPGHHPHGQRVDSGAVADPRRTGRTVTPSKETASFAVAIAEYQRRRYGHSRQRADDRPPPEPQVRGRCARPPATSPITTGQGGDQPAACQPYRSVQPPQPGRRQSDVPVAAGRSTTSRARPLTHHQVTTIHSGIRTIGVRTLSIGVGDLVPAYMVDQRHVGHPFPATGGEQGGLTGGSRTGRRASAGADGRGGRPGAGWPGRPARTAVPGRAGSSWAASGPDRAPRAGRPGRTTCGAIRSGSRRRSLTTVRARAAAAAEISTSAATRTASAGTVV